MLRIERPHPNLMTYYALSSLLAGPFFFVPLVYLYFRYHTMRYRFDADGVKMSWGILFRREVSLTYARVQDIHLTSNLVERWLGLAEVKLSTASGSASAEMTIEGLARVRAGARFPLREDARRARQAGRARSRATGRGRRHARGRHRRAAPGERRPARRARRPGAPERRWPR